MTDCERVGGGWGGEVGGSVRIGPNQDLCGKREFIRIRQCRYDSMYFESLGPLMVVEVNLDIRYDGHLEKTG